MTTPQYPQQPYGAQPPYGPPPQPPRKKVLWPWLLLGALLVVCGAGSCGALIVAAGNSSDTSTSVPGPRAPKAAPKNNVAPAGSAVRDGKFEFVVTAVDAPVKTVGDNQFLRETAQGEYILIHITITNIGNEPRGYFGSNQKLIDDQNREFTNDTRAEINVNEHLHADINPGNKLDVVLAFDVPVGAVPATLELHDSMLSGGAKVALR